MVKANRPRRYPCWPWRGRFVPSNTAQTPQNKALSPENKKAVDRVRERRYRD